MTPTELDAASAQAEVDLAEAKASGTPTASWSQMSSYLDCGEKWRLSYIEKVPRIPQGTFIAGRAIHECIEAAEGSGDWANLDYFKEGMPGEELFLHEFHRIIEEEVADSEYPIRWAGRKTKEFPRGEDQMWWERSGPMMLRRYTETRREDEEEGNRGEATEMLVGAYLPSGTYVRGYIDKMMLFGPDGFPIIRDWKTGRPGGASPAQLAVYAWALREAMGYPVKWGEFVYLRTPDRAKRIERYDLTDELELVERRFADFEAARDAGLYPIRESNFCVSCSVRPHCPAGQVQMRREAAKEVKKDGTK